ncbi:MAG: NTP transferase domain-containing protein [Novosphingobium sp.]|nr:NTP transferase domain-containing protein [Novosphingobium sp.]MCP5402100.1 NTP transferase domain-containing protein [Novosphingobium sp.]
MNATSETATCTVVILAAQRAGVVNPLAVRAGVSHKCLVPICGKPLIVHVLDVLAAQPAVGAVRISVEPDANEELAKLVAPYRERGLGIEFVASSSNIVESVMAAVEGQRAPFVITTADNVLLTGETFQNVLDALRDADVVMNLAAKPSVQSIHPEAQRRFYEFRDEGYANCNLYGVAGAEALRAAEIFREGGQFMKNPQRLINAFGLFNILLFRFKLLSLESAAGRISRKFGLRFKALVPEDGSQAVDVDNERTYDVAEMVLKQRAATAEG